jgi:hypothetical protein
MSDEWMNYRPPAGFLPWPSQDVTYEHPKSENPFVRGEWAYGERNSTGTGEFSCNTTVYLEKGMEMARIAADNERFVTDQPDRSDDTLTAVRNPDGSVTIEIDEPWAGDTESGFGRTCSIELSPQQAAAFEIWLGASDPTCSKAPT